MIISSIDDCFHIDLDQIGVVDISFSVLNGKIKINSKVYTLADIEVMYNVRHLHAMKSAYL